MLMYTYYTLYVYTLGCKFVPYRISILCYYVSRVIVYLILVYKINSTFVISISIMSYGKIKKSFEKNYNHGDDIDRQSFYFINT